MPSTSRFYKNATIAADDETRGRFRLLLDGKPAMTPAGAVLTLAGGALADSVAAEWRAQTGKIDPASMPLTRLAVSAVDHVAPRMGEVRIEALAYAESDLLCYRAPAPAALGHRQHATWQPLLDWAAAALGAKLEATEGIAPVPQTETAAAALVSALEKLDAEHLLVAHALAHRTGSLILALAVLHGRLSAPEAFAMSRLDEIWQAEQWGFDEEASERTRRIGVEIDALARFLDLLPDMRLWPAGLVGAAKND